MAIGNSMGLPPFGYKTAAGNHLPAAAHGRSELTTDRLSRLSDLGFSHTGLGEGYFVLERATRDLRAILDGTSVSYLIRPRGEEMVFTRQADAAGAAQALSTALNITFELPTLGEILRDGKSVLNLNEKYDRRGPPVQSFWTATHAPDREGKSDVDFHFRTEPDRNDNGFWHLELNTLMHGQGVPFEYGAQLLLVMR